MSLYLKYRPRDFESLVWQKFIKQTLKNALQNDKLVGAYLFTWPRGTGKTSTARILALGMNCQSNNNKPCYECSICQSFSNNQLLDIIEIDAASNTWVDNIREIIERAQFTPNQTRYKVYIIDEVHMLSKGAFNALLKILEEPPTHVKFILATTEIHKVPETILSRCQRYDFKSINDEDVKERLLYIAKTENIEVEEKALSYVIKNAKWWLRNAINLFEQLNIWWKISYDYIIENLGITEEDIVLKVFSKLQEKDRSVIWDYQELVNSWKNIRLFFKDLFYICKDKVIENAHQWKEFSRIQKMLEVLDETFTKSKNSFDEQITFLTGILKLLESKEEKVNPIPTSNKAQDSTKKEIEPKVKTPENKNKETPISPILSEWDITDIFWSEEDIPLAKNDWALFNKDSFIQKLKESGMKGSIIISLKGANFQQQWNEVFVKLATSFALKTLEIEKNIGLFISGLESVWIKNPKIQFSA